MAAPSIRIVKGPSKFDLMIAFFDNNVNNTRPVDFELSDGEKIRVGIRGITREDGSGESWIIDSYFWGTTPHPHFGQDIKLYYSTRHRRGCLMAD